MTWMPWTCSSMWTRPSHPSRLNLKAKPGTPGLANEVVSFPYLLFVTSYLKNRQMSPKPNTQNKERKITEAPWSTNQMTSFWLWNISPLGVRTELQDILRHSTAKHWRRCSNLATSHPKWTSWTTQPIYYIQCIYYIAIYIYIVIMLWLFLQIFKYIYIYIYLFTFMSISIQF